MPYATDQNSLATNQYLWVHSVNMYCSGAGLEGLLLCLTAHHSLGLRLTRQAVFAPCSSQGYATRLHS